MTQYRWPLPLVLLFLGAILGMIVLVGCISTSSEPEITATRAAQVLTPADPPAVFDLQTGATVYADNCAPCHGESGGGDGPSASAFSCEVPAFANGSPDQTMTDWYMVAFDGKRSSELCIMPPWSRQLAANDIWSAVAYAAHLRYDQSLATTGESLLATHASGEADFLTDTFWQAGNTDADILAAIRANNLPGFDFSGTGSDGLSEDEQQAVLVAIRRRAATDAIEVAQAPESTEEAQPAPAPEATEEALESEPIAPENSESSALSPPGSSQPSAPPDTPSTEQISVAGRVVSGTDGASVPQNLNITLRVISLDTGGQPVEVFTADAMTDSSNAYVFTDIPYDLRAVLLLETQYGGVVQTAPEIFAADVSEGNVNADLTIYEVTEDASTVSLLYVESLVDAVTAESASLIFQTFEFVNDGDRIVTGLEIPLPAGAVNASAESGAEGRFIQQGNSFIDTQPIFPGTGGQGRVHRADVRYNLPYNGQMQIEQSFPYAVAEIAVYVPQHRGLEVESERLNAIAAGELNGVAYLGFGGGGILPNAPFVYTVSDTRPAGSSTSPLNDTNTLILGIGVLIIIAGGMFMLYDLQKTRLSAQQSAKKSGKKSKGNRDDLVSRIAALDESYENQLIETDEYKAARKILKNKLRRLVE